MIKNLLDILPRQGNIKIGMKGEIRKGKSGNDYQIPEKIDHFIITGMERDDRNNFIRDPDIEKIVTRKSNDNGATTIGPVIFVYDEIELNFYTAFRAFTASQLRCRGNGEIAKQKDDKGVETEIKCDPENCPIFKAKGCKPNGILSVIFPAIKRVSGVFQFRTTSWNSITSIRSQYRLFHTLCKGRIAGIPFNLCINKKEVYPEGKKTIIYYVTMDYDGSMRDMLEASKKCYLGSAPVTKEIEQAKVAMLEAHIEEDTDEFYPEHTIEPDGKVIDKATGEVVDRVDVDPVAVANGDKNPFAKKPDDGDVKKPDTAIKTSGAKVPNGRKKVRELPESMRTPMKVETPVKEHLEAKKEAKENPSQTTPDDKQADQVHYIELTLNKTIEKFNALKINTTVEDIIEQVKDGVRDKYKLNLAELQIVNQVLVNCVKENEQSSMFQ